jgi:hypothetical protein
MNNGMNNGMNNSMNNGMNNSMNNGMNNGMNNNQQQNVQPQMQPQMHAPPSATEILRAVVNNNNETHGLSAIKNIPMPNNVGGEIKVVAEETVALTSKNLMIALAFLVALAWNDAIKYFISRNIKLNRASPYYYLYYALIVTLLAVILTNVLA